MARLIDLDELLRFPLRRGSKYLDEEHANAHWLNGVEAVLEYAEQLLTFSPPAEPLTLEELRMIVEPTPVWWDWIQGWVLAYNGMILSWNAGYRNCGGVRGDFYRRPPEGEEDT